ncbi:MAG: hypothetical protein E4H16_03340 [Candidatus Atribacteria bacterium]|nr:MAG: hypothetical protein E4H16_03340 [Candidatus Atribacteria bacterium]
MKNATLLTLLTLIFAVFTAGCIDELIAVDQSADIPDIYAYEFDVFVNETANDDSTVVNTTTFYLLNNASLKAVHMLVNASILDIMAIDDLSSNSDTPTNIVVIADHANETHASIEMFTIYSRANSVSDINYALTKNVVFGQKQTYLEFNETITGFVAYTMSMPKGQDFAHHPTPASIVRLVLPPGYTTGNPFIGTARPKPDKVYSDDEGREKLIWYDLDSRDTIIVKYYSKSAPRMLLIGGTILAIGTLIILASSRITQQRLKKIRDQIEEDASKRKNNKKNK